MRATSSIVVLVATSLFLSACGGDAAGAEGTYALDMTAMKPVIEEMAGPAMAQAKKALEMLPPEQRAAMEKKVTEQQAEMLSNFDFEVTLEGDGSFRVVGVKDGKDQAKGTWKLEGTKLLITTTHQRGKKEEEPETLEGTLENGVITFKPDKSMPFDLVFRKK
jgi:hypothetical protein